MNKQLLILSAEIVNPSMQPFFGELPSCMIPIHNQLAIDYIYHENVNHYDHIYIVLQKESQLVIEYLNHSQYSITPIIIDEVKDLSYSLRQGLEKINKKISTTIIFGDTYLPYMTSYISEEKDFLFISETHDSNRWTTIDFDKENNILFTDKQNSVSKEPFKTIIGIFHISNTEKLLKLSTENSNQHFYPILQHYFNNNSTLQVLQTDKWIDYGHIDKYFLSKEVIEPRFFNNLIIDKKAKTLLKKSTNINKFISEIKWFKNVPTELKTCTPHIYSYSTDPKNPFIKMQYYHEAFTLHDFFINCNHSSQTWRKILFTLKDLTSNFSKHQAPFQIDVQKERYDMYVSKTIDRLTLFKKQDLLSADNPITINNKKYPSLNSIIDNIDRIVDENNLITNEPFVFIHGDLCFANILYDIKEHTCKLIDPRGVFGNIEQYGDPLYEWAKISHSIDGKYDFIIADKFNLIQSKNDILYKFHTYHIHNKITPILYNELINNKTNAKKIKLIQALLFFSMLPLHNDKPRRQYIMLARALELITEYL